jgi:triacylglycerol lipase
MPLPLELGMIGLVILSVAAIALLIVRARRKRRARRRGRALAPRHALVLLHGVLGFDEIGLGWRRHAYFRGVAERLEGLGARVHRPRLPASASVAERASRLVRVLRDFDGGRVNVIAHSMGGLDARYAISRLGLANRVVSLTTIGTPHLGTPLADLGTGLADLLQLKRVLRRVMKLDAFWDLTTTNMAAFNRDVPNAKQVAYASVVARTPEGARMHPLLKPAYLYLSVSSGANDGLVPVISQRWGDVMAEIEADHWAQIGWSQSSDFDAPALFEEIARELRARGF